MDDIDPTSVSSESSFFIEADEVLQLICALAVPARSQIEDEIETINENESKTCEKKVKGNEALRRLRVIFDKYLECPTLLDPHLEKIVTTLSRNAADIAHQIYNHDTITEIPESEREISNERIVNNLKRYLSAIYVISKVRGRKHIQKFLSHDACDVEPVLHALRFMEKYKDDSSNFNLQYFTWESTYVLLVWLGMLSLVPFDLNTIDSSLKFSGDGEGEKENNNSDTRNEKTLISSMLGTARKYLSGAAVTRDAAASSLSSLLSRPDLEEAELEDFVLFSNDVLKRYLEPNKSGFGSDIYLVLGVSATLANIFKTGSRSNLMDRHLRCVEMLWEQAILVAEMAAPKVEVGKVGSGGGAMLLRKQLVKLFARVGCSYLPPRVASWRYQRGRRSLLENLGTTATNERVISSGNNANCNAHSFDKELKLNRDNHFFRVPNQVEDCMAQLVHALNDPATTVRWSAAKGIGRVTERLPAICADDVLDAILELCEDIENDNAWHGACLSLAELARRGLLLPRRLGEVIPVVIRAIQYDIPRGSHSVGANVRDSACYTCWAFARAYAPDIMETYVPDLSKSIVIASLFDREINCRRAASAAFQECVGRQGAVNFKHGIEILTAADYFTLGNRSDAFTSVAFYVAGFEEYRRSIIDHLTEDKLFHWDKQIRFITSTSLRWLTKLDRKYFAYKVLPNLITCSTHENLFVRHGALLGIAEIVFALGNLDQEQNGSFSISDEVLVSVSNVVFVIEKARLYRGRGGEIMRSAVSRLIECMANSTIPMTVKQQVGLLDILDSNLKHPTEDIQIAAADALHAVTRSYFPVGENGPSQRLHKKVVQTYINTVMTEENPAATRGFSLALGRLPTKLVAPNSTVLDSVIDCLCRSCHPQALVGGQRDAETRKNAIEALVFLCETVGIGTSPDAHCMYPVVAMNSMHINKIFQSLLDATEDYNTDRRGDVGSWSRIAAMKGLEKLVYLTIEASNIPQNAFCKRQGDNSDAFLSQIPSFTVRFDSLEPNAENRAKSCFINNEPFRDDTRSSSNMYFDDAMCSKVIGAMLKQLSEKLDAVRNEAGASLQRILVDADTSVPFVFDKDVLVEALSLHTRTDINWAHPESTFPLVMRAINIDIFFDEILAGMIISVGGLTESVTKHSSKSFLEYLRALKSTRNIGKMAKMGNGLIRLFDKYGKNGRVILPLLVTLDKILSHGSLDQILTSPDQKFAQELGLRIRKEAVKCIDIKRLMAIVPVALNILHCDKPSVQKTLLLFLMRLLAHRYPRIRRHTAEQLYVKLLEDETVVPAPIQLEEATDLLSRTQWDKDLGPPSNIRETRNKVAELLGISLPEKDRVGRIKSKIVKPSDDFESYASLVKTAGF